MVNHAVFTYSYLLAILHQYTRIRSYECVFQTVQVSVIGSRGHVLKTLPLDAVWEILDLILSVLLVGIQLATFTGPALVKDDFRHNRLHLIFKLGLKFDISV